MISSSYICCCVKVSLSFMWCVHVSASVHMLYVCVPFLLRQRLFVLSESPKLCDTAAVWPRLYGPEKENAANERKQVPVFQCCVLSELVHQAWEWTDRTDWIPCCVKIEYHYKDSLSLVSVFVRCSAERSLSSIFHQRCVQWMKWPLRCCDLQAQQGLLYEKQDGELGLPGLRWYKMAA